MVRFRAFEREGRCYECGYIGPQDDGLCIVCQNLIPDGTPATITAAAWLDELSECAFCGVEHAHRTADLCKRCLKETV